MQKIILAFLLVLQFQLKSIAQNDCNCTITNKETKETKAYATILLNEASKICQAKAFCILGELMIYSDKPDSAIFYLLQAETILLQQKCNDSLFVSAYKNLAQAYYTKANFAKAQEYSLKMLPCAEAANNVLEITKCCTMIAQLFNQTNQANKGIVYTRKAVGYLPKLTNQKERREILFFIAKRYLWHYQDTKTIGSLDSSELYGKEYLSLAKSLQNKASTSKAFSHLQGIAFEKSDFKTALQLLDSSFLYLEKNDYDNVRANYFDKADILIELKNYEAAAQMADSALQYDKLAGNIIFTAETYSLIARIAEKKGDYKKAFTYNNLATNITDSVRNVESIANVTELEKKYNQSKNEKTIVEISKKKQLYLLLAIVGVLAAIVIAFYLRQQALQHKKNILETEQRLNRARMNPHFFFNALATLQKIALTENNGEVMASNLSKFSNIMRDTLESTYKDYVTIEQEIEFLNEYIEVQKIRFPKAFEANINCSKELEIDELQIPSMIIQPFIENCIEHGFAGIDYMGIIEINFAKANNELQIEIKDNGIGLHTSTPNNNEHISRASQIIKDRIYLLNIKLKTKAGFKIDNNENDKGVVVKIHLPLLYK
jgi:tetratricopeptide (TPR) repeat protein